MSEDFRSIFTFKVSDLIAGLTRSNQWEWHGPCKAEVGPLDHSTADLSVEPISECDLITGRVISNFDKQPAENMPANNPVPFWSDEKSVAAAVTELLAHGENKADVQQQLQNELSAAQNGGTADAMILVYWPEPKAALGVTIGLRPQKYELFRTFVMLHFGRADLTGRIICRFHGFAAEGGLILPTDKEFFEGRRPYLVVDDSSIVFSANPPVLEGGLGRRLAANLPSKDEAPRIAANIAKLQELLR